MDIVGVMIVCHLYHNILEQNYMRWLWRKNSYRPVRTGQSSHPLTEAKILIEEWRKEYNQVRPHSVLDYRPPARQAIIPLTLAQQMVLE